MSHAPLFIHDRARQSERRRDVKSSEEIKHFFKKRKEEKIGRENKEDAGS